MGALPLSVLFRADWHRRWEGLPMRFSVWVVIAVVSASLFEIIPTFVVKSNVETIASGEPLRRRAPAAVGVALLVLGVVALSGRFSVPALSTARATGDAAERVESIDDAALPCCAGGGDGVPTD